VQSDNGAIFFMPLSSLAMPGTRGQFLTHDLNDFGVFQHVLLHQAASFISKITE